MRKVQSLGKSSAEIIMKVMQYLFKLPIVDVKKIQELTGYTRQGSNKVIDRLVKLKILKPMYKYKKYRRVFVYKRYLDIFSSE